MAYAKMKLKFSVMLEVFLTISYEAAQDLVERLMKSPLVKWDADQQLRWNTADRQDPLGLELALEKALKEAGETTLYAIVGELLNGYSGDAVELVDWVFHEATTPVGICERLQQRQQTLSALRGKALVEAEEKIQKEDFGDAESANEPVWKKGKMPTAKQKGKPLGKKLRAADMKSNSVEVATVALKKAGYTSSQPAAPKKTDKVDFTDLKSVWKTLQNDEPDLTLQAYTGRLNNLIVWPILTSLGFVKAQTTPKREDVFNDKTSITYYVEGQRLIGKKDLLQALKSVLRTAVASAEARPKSVKITFNNFPSA